MSGSIITTAAVSLAWTLVAATLLSVVQAGRRRWRLARWLAVGITIASLLYPVGVMVGVSLIANADASRRATLLAAGVSEALNCSAMVGLAAIVAVAVILVASIRLRREAREAAQ